MLPKFKIQHIKNQSLQNSHKRQQILLRLRKPNYKKQGVQLTPGTQQILLSSFSCLIIGKPGSGKSHLINELIDLHEFYRQKFDRIIYIGPTRYQSVVHDQFNTNNVFDMKWIQKHIQNCQGWASNMLIIFDDVVSQIPSSQKNSLQQLYFNRRHLLKTGCISIILTSQKYASVPTWVRCTLNCIFSFAIAKNQMKSLFNQIPLMSNLQLIKKSYQQLQKHGFIYFNLQRAKAFTDKFIQL